MDERFIAWLQQVTPKKSSWTTRLSDLRRVEAAYGDLDAAYDSDEMQSLFDELTYTADELAPGDVLVLNWNPSTGDGRCERAGSAKSRSSAF